jgi:hypothetical protein
LFDTEAKDDKLSKVADTIKAKSEIIRRDKDVQAVTYNASEFDKNI